MEIWFTIIISVSAALLLRAIFNLRQSSSCLRLPPGPDALPILGALRWARAGLGGLPAFLRSLHRRLGPIVTIHITTRPSIYVANRSLAYQALVQNGAVFADRPAASATSKILTSNQHDVSSSSYGATWRILRRNLSSKILHPSRVISYSHARRWVLQILLDRFRASQGEEAIRVIDHLQYAMFALLVRMCFGDKLDEKQISSVGYVQQRLLISVSRLNVLDLWPKLTKILLRKRWEEFFQHWREQEDVLLPLIRARKKIIEEKGKSTVADDKDYVLSYVDTLLDLELPEEKRKLTEGEMVSLCSEFLSAGTDTTSTALQWIMANLVKYPHIQEKIYAEIKGVVGESNEETEAIREEDLQKMPYLKAVVLETLRRHPPGHLVLPHAVTNDTVLGGYRVPKNGTINFMVAEMGWDPEVWEEPMAFKPERFVGKSSEEVDITGSRGIKMMPFGVGRRMCPALGLAMLHLEYFVANLVWQFRWKVAEGGDVDLSEKQEFTAVMKHPLEAHAVPRRQIKCWNRFASPAIQTTPMSATEYEKCKRNGGKEEDEDCA